MSEFADIADVVVVGGGIIGCSVAYRSAQEGVDCLVLERTRTNGEASGVTAANIHIQVNNSAINDVGKDFTQEFLDHMRAKALLHRESAIVWRGLEAELGCDVGVVIKGGFIVAETDEQMESLATKVKFERSIGLETEMIGPSELRRLAPALAHDLKGGSYFENEGFANPMLVTPALVGAAKRLGARFRLQCEVLSIERTGRHYVLHTPAGKVRANRIVNAAGAWAGRVAAMLNVRLPVTGHVVHMNVTEPWPPRLAQVVLHAGRRLTLKQTQYGTFVIGGGWAGRYEAASNRKTTRWESIVGNTYNAVRVLPLLKEVRLARTWGGMFPKTPGSTPLIGEIPGTPGFFAASMTAGFTVGPAVGGIMADLLTGRSPRLSVDPYAPAAAA